MQEFVIKKLVFRQLSFSSQHEDRASIVLTSPADPETQRQFARDRGWNFRMVSTRGTHFNHDTGFEPEPGKYWPGASVFRRDVAGRLFHVSKAPFGPRDAFCAVWHFLDLLPTDKEWQPKFTYAESIKHDMAHGYS